MILIKALNWNYLFMFILPVYIIQYLRENNLGYSGLYYEAIVSREIHLYYTKLYIPFLYIHVHV